MIVEIVRHISMIMEIFSPAADILSGVWYNYLYSDSNRSVILTPIAMAIISSWNNVGDTLPFSMLLSVDFPIPDFFANSTNVNRFSVLISHKRIFTLLTSFHKEVYKVIWFSYRNGKFI